MTTPIETLTLRFELLSAATFGRGDGLPGIVDREVEHDALGLPFLRGRTLRGLLAEEMKSLLHALEPARAEQWEAARQRLLGAEGCLTEETGIMRVGDARLPEPVRDLITVTLAETRDGRLTPAAMLEALTAVRRQTAMTQWGAPDPASLRAMRVVLRGLTFESRLTFDQQLGQLDKSLLAATVLAWRRAGTGRNRGRGRLRAWLEDDDWMQEQFAIFQQRILNQKGAEQ